MSIEGEGIAQPATRLARALLIALAFVLPFEAPLCHVGRLQLTSLETMLYATLAVWGLAAATHAWQQRARPPEIGGLGLRDPAVVAVSLWTLVVFITAAMASNRADTLKFALRSLSGILGFFAARTLATPRPVARRVLFAIVLGGLVSAATAVVDFATPSSFALWSFFRDQGFATFGLPRASGVFAYPTIGAMYWEATLPLLLVVPFSWRMRAPYRRWLVLVGGALLSFAVVASATRSSLAGGLVICGGVYLSTRRWEAPVARTSVVLAVTMLATATLASLGPGAGTLLRQRIRFWHDDAWFGVTYQAGHAPETVEAGDTFFVPVTLRNTGTLTWTHEGRQSTQLSNHWYVDEQGARGAPVVFDGQRTRLPADVPPGGEVTLVGRAKAPTPGRYRFVWDVVQEDVTWFSEHGTATAEEGVVVLPRTSPLTSPPEELAVVTRKEVAPMPGRPALWGAALKLWTQSPLLGVGPDNFRRRYEAVLSSAANGQPYVDTRIHANSLFFETLADMGLLGLLALAALSVALFRALGAHLRARDILGVGFGAATASFFVHGLTDYFLEFTPAFGLFWLLAGLLAIPPAAPADTPP